MRTTEKEWRPHETHVLSRRHGRLHVEITCPFCGTVMDGYAWSLAGSGKRCTGTMADGTLCKALHGLGGSVR